MTGFILTIPAHVYHSISPNMHYGPHESLHFCKLFKIKKNYTHCHQVAFALKVDELDGLSQLQLKIFHDNQQEDVSCKYNKGML